MKKIPLSFLLVVALSLSVSTWAQTTMKQVSLQIGKYKIRAEVAKTETERNKGLMFRKKLALNSGMLFDFGAPAQVCMWMKDTYIPLSVAFIDSDGVIVNIEDMKEQTTDSHCGDSWVRYALEMNQGWFLKRKIVPGQKVSFPENF